MSETNCAGKWYLTAVGLSLCVISGIFIALMWRSYARAKGMTSWPKVPCLILQSSVEEQRIGATVAPEYRLQVLYCYDFDGSPYESRLWSLRGSMPRNDRATAEELVATYSSGSMTQCWVNPRQPSQAVLKLDTRAAGYTLWFPGLFLLGGMGMIVGAWKRPRSAKLA
ncbi:MAG: hypothetical protein CAK88_07795 [Verrucomicrobiia bacterium AMD-G2]|nr:MAG: hypothetical protein CAK88_07795 [Verrucomicrobiae bacterium AMD-G2]